MTTLILAIALTAAPDHSLIDTRDHVLISRPVVAPVRAVLSARDRYLAARKAHLESNRPLCVALTATWCASCHVVEPLLPATDDKRIVLVLDVDQDRELAVAIAGRQDYTIPLVAVYERGKRRPYVGVQAIKALLGRP